MWVIRILTGFTGTIAVNQSIANNANTILSEYAGTLSVGFQMRSTPTTADPSQTITLTQRRHGRPRIVGAFTCNNGTPCTAGIGNLREAPTQGGATTGALVDSDGDTISVTHANATWADGIIELYAGGSDAGNGAYSFGGSGTNGYMTAGWFQNFYTGVPFTTGSAPYGYWLNSASLLTNNAGSGAANFRAAIYNDNAEPLKALIADSGIKPFGTAGGSGTPSLHVAPFFSDIILPPNTPHHVAWNTDSATAQYRVDDTTTAAGTLDRNLSLAFGVPPDPWGATSTDNAGPHMWVHLTPVLPPESPIMPRWPRTRYGY